ncbi:MAG: sulfite exporter TauE/SafE family protein [Paludibacter sp.]|nr:sulfite exporter TauE/SafE family protein [Paludibacter sp.]
MEIGILILGILAGIMSGLFGIGGGIIMVPSLIAIFGMGMLNANATSLAAMLLPVGILGVIAFYKAGLIQLRNALWISLGLLAGSYFGAEMAISVDVKVLSKLYAAFLLYVAVGYLDIPKLLRRNKQHISTENIVNGEEIDYPFWQFILLGIFAGVIAGLFGKGGGLVIVPMLVKYFRYNPKAASATSLAALQLPVGLPSVIVYAHAGYLNWLYAGLMALGIVFGVFFGTKLAIKLPTTTFKKVYAVFLLGVAVYMVYKYI